MDQPVSVTEETGTAKVPVFDRAADERMKADTVSSALADTTTLLVVVDGDKVPVDSAGALRFLSAAEFPVAADRAVFLGRLGAHAMILASADDDNRSVLGSTASMRDVVASSSEAVSEIVVTAIALGRWVRDAAFCPTCGGTATLTTSGWARRCVVCDREHFPRTDPAVIVAVTDGDRLLLGSNALWEHDRFSCFAGFVEAGESLESAVAREVAEEAGVQVSGITYAGSQAWPYPRSLMLGFHAHVDDATAALADGEEILEVRWFSRDEIRSALAGESSITLPGPASIARALITQWAEAAA